ncbi:MAG: glutathione synthase [Desulfobacula sp.]|nr:glutathione synthase [Desulfobacula sp.]
MNVCFIMCPWHKIIPEQDTTLRLIHECILRNHTVAMTTTHNLTMRDTVASAFCNVFVKKSKVPEKAIDFYEKAVFQNVGLPLSGFDVIVMRADPPLDVLALNFLDSVHDSVFFVNDIDGLRIANNKLYTASFDDPEHRFIPITHVSKNQEYLENVLEDSPAQKMIMKPLDGYGGKGVILIEKRARHNFKSLLDYYINNRQGGSYVIMQEYVKGADKGDIRILILNGEPIGALRRVPSPGEVRSNVHAGGRPVKHNITDKEMELCRHIGPKLIRDGLFFVGIDVINCKLIEVNVLSPGCMVPINRLNKVRLQEKVIDFVENVIRIKDSIAIRKSEFRKAIEDANNI